MQCKKTFTTHERPVMDAKLSVLHKKNGQTEPFYQGKIIHSIIRSFAHDEQFGINNALPLSDTIVSLLLPVGQSMTTAQIATTCHAVLQRFDATAAAHYAFAHNQFMGQKRRRKGI